jgi:purine-binding chemotaxis protein CheW
MRAEAAAVKETTQYLTFVVAGEEYAIPILRVREILAYIPLTRVPRAPKFVAGVMNLRGSVVPVVDLRVKLGLAQTEITPRTCIVIVEVEGEQGATTMALLTEEVKEVIELADEEIEPAPAFGTRIDLSFLFGMGDMGDHFALILNADKVLTTLELIAASQAVAEATAAPEKHERRNKRARKE